MEKERKFLKKILKHDQNDYVIAFSWEIYMYDHRPLFKRVQQMQQTHKYDQ